MSKRILGDARIFQSVFNDLGLSHDIVTDSKGRQRYAYVYEGADPYEAEDISFPQTVKLIQRQMLLAAYRSRIDELEWTTGHANDDRIAELKRDIERIEKEHEDVSR